MAIQIDEKHLSPEAKRALNNAKSKSQFMRDAIEFYVSRNVQNIQVSCDSEIKDDIKEIKAMLKKLSIAGITLDEVSSTIKVESSNEEIKAEPETKVDSEPNKVINISQVSLTSEVNTDEVKRTDDNNKSNNVGSKNVNNENDLEDVEIPECYDF